MPARMQLPGVRNARGFAINGYDGWYVFFYYHANHTNAGWNIAKGELGIPRQLPNREDITVLKHVRTNDIVIHVLR